jgi:hypothetical protein
MEIMSFNMTIAAKKEDENKKMMIDSFGALILFIITSLSIRRPSEEG